MPIYVCIPLLLVVLLGVLMAEEGGVGLVNLSSSAFLRVSSVSWSLVAFFPPWRDGWLLSRAGLSGLIMQSICNVN